MIQAARYSLLAFTAVLLLFAKARLSAADAPPRASTVEPVVRALPAPGDGAAVTGTLYAPQPVPEGKAGLVVHLYGSGGSHESYNVGRPPVDEFRRLLAARAYWLVVPELGPRHWMNDAACNQVDAVIAAMVQHERVDPGRVHLLGTSMGGGSSEVVRP